MSDTLHFDPSGTHSTGVTGRTRRSRLIVPVGTVLALSLLSGCALMPKHHITVGSVPDDYRTNHPIVLSEQEEIFDVPVARSHRKLTTAQRGPIEGFMSGYTKNGSGPVRIVMPMGSANEAAASRIGGQIGRLLRKRGIPPSKISFSNYQVTSADAAAPVRITYTALSASTGQCGRWPDDLHKTSENKHYANFGCSYQNNLAAQIANPSDLLGPREPTGIDAANRGVVIDTYQNAEPVFDPTISY